IPCTTDISDEAGAPAAADASTPTPRGMRGGRAGQARDSAFGAASAGARAGTSSGAPWKFGGRVRRAAQAAHTTEIATMKQAVVYQTLPIGTPWPVMPSSASRYSGIDTAHRKAITARYTPVKWRANGLS